MRCFEMISRQLAPLSTLLGFKMSGHVVCGAGTANLAPRFLRRKLSPQSMGVGSAFGLSQVSNAGAKYNQMPVVDE